MSSRTPAPGGSNADARDANETTRAVALTHQRV